MPLCACGPLCVCVERPPSVHHQVRVCVLPVLFHVLYWYAVCLLVFWGLPDALGMTVPIAPGPRRVSLPLSPALYVGRALCFVCSVPAGYTCFVWCCEVHVNLILDNSCECLPCQGPRRACSLRSLCATALPAPKTSWVVQLQAVGGSWDWCHVTRVGRAVRLCTL